MYHEVLENSVPIKQVDQINEENLLDLNVLSIQSGK